METLINDPQLVPAWSNGDVYVSENSWDVKRYEYLIFIRSL